MSELKQEIRFCTAHRSLRRCARPDPSKMAVMRLLAERVEYA